MKPWDPIDLDLCDLRKATHKSLLLDLVKVKRVIHVAEQYHQVVERRQIVVDEMAEELGDENYPKFELKLWWDLYYYWHSGKTVADRDALARALIGTLNTFLSPL